MQGETAEYSVLSLLASKERVIETLKRELEDKNNALENRKQKEGKLKVQISTMKGMIRPLRDEQVHLLEEMKSDNIEKHRLQSELDTMKIKLKKVERMKEEAVKVRGELGAINEKLTFDQETRDITMERLENRARKAEAYSDELLSGYIERTQGPTEAGWEAAARRGRSGVCG